MIVRAAGRDDAARVVAVIHAAFADYSGKLRPESAALAETEATVARQLADHGGFVVEADGRMVGAVLYELKRDAIYFGRLAVLPAERGRGLAAALLRAVEGEGRRRGVARVTMGVRVELPDNAAFFARHGYREIGRTAPPGSATPFLIDMAKNLQNPGFPDDARAQAMVVRAARADEAAAIVAVVQSAFAEYRGKLQPESAALSETADMVARQLADHGGLVAETEGRIVGAVLFKLKPGEVYLGRLAVPPAERGRGIAGRLLRAVEDEARRRGAARVTLGVRIALPENAAFFERRGYRETGRSTHAGFAAPTSIDLAKILDP